MSAKRRSAKRDNNVYELSEALVANGRAQELGPKRKTWTQHDLKAVKPLTPNQNIMFDEFSRGQHVVANGSAGTGKTFLACYLALNELLDPDTQYERIIIVRSAVPTRDVGFMPGTLEEKVALYELPYRDIFADLLRRRNSYQDMKDAGLVEFCTTSYVRGLTWDNALIIIDECQSATFHEINSVMTRIGKHSRIIIAGDIPQTDLRKKGETSGFDQLVAVAKYMKMFSVINFSHMDIVRSDFVRSWIINCDKLNITA